MHKPKTVAFDLDGTLALSKQPLSLEMGALLSELLRETPVAIMSGAGFSQFQKQFFPALRSDAKLENLYMFPVNAAQCYVYQDSSWKPQYDNAFTTAEKETILSALQSSLQEVGLAEEPAQLWGTRIEDREAQISFSPLGQQAPVSAKEEWAKKFGHTRRELHATLVKKLPDFAVAMGGITTIDITRKGVSKAYGVERFSELTKIPIAEMLYVGDALGDGGNDAVVLQTNIPVHAVSGPEETATLIKTILASV